MMYLNEPTPFDLVKKQLRYKLNANAATFTTLVILQLIVLFMNFPTSTSTHYYADDSSLSVIEISSAMHVACAMIWAFSLGIILASKGKREEMFTFVTNRFTHHFSNLLFMMIASLCAGVMSVLLNSALRLLTHLRYDEVTTSALTITEAPVDFLIQLITATAYVFLLFIIGYTICSFVQIGKLYAGIMIIAVVFYLFINNFIIGSPFLVSLFLFFINEHVLPIFLLKVIGATVVLFGISILTTNQVEVRDQ